MTLIKDISQFKAVSLNMDYQRMMHYIEHVELRYIKSLLGEELYEDIQKEDSSNKANNDKLLEKLTPAIAYYAYGEAMMNESDKLTPTGLVNKVNDYSNPVDGNAIMFKYKKACRDAEFFVAEALDFLLEYKDDFPLWERGQPKRSCKRVNVSFL